MNRSCLHPQHYLFGVYLFKLRGFLPRLYDCVLLLMIQIFWISTII
nr:MAG TPA: hypothetical protein [Bacteriophage sp.]